MKSRSHASVPKPGLAVVSGGTPVSLAGKAASSHPVIGTGDTDALIKLRVACDLAINAARELGNPLPLPLEDQINDLCDAIQTELEARDSRFIRENRQAG
jgi:hypothetical protein